MHVLLFLHDIKAKTAPFEVIRESAAVTVAVKGTLESTCVKAIGSIFFQAEPVTIQGAIDCHLVIPSLGMVIIGALDVAAIDLDVHGDAIL